MTAGQLNRACHAAAQMAEIAKRVDKDMTLAARDLLARIEALRVERSAPF
jgi:hypothetical protein